MDPMGPRIFAAIVFLVLAFTAAKLVGMALVGLRRK